MKIVELDPSNYRGHTIEDKYITRYLRFIKIKKSKAVRIIIKKKRIFQNKERSISFKLFDEHLDNSQVFGIFEGKKMIALIEGAMENWNNTYRIWNLYVTRRHRKEGLGSALFEHMELLAKHQGARAIVLEVQSCNDPAINFYEKHGLHFIGLNTIAYSNEDVQNKEVRLEYGKRL
jgi:ribosomal protein S18 acetylase RimI-like enzyme